ncbi:MAG: serine/threonine protein kinase [Planctomycetaceae bacterium]|jgi:serine/threonine protein kinase|nr:serine/threonine protein kinase [Planctomycetaceae bacterium]
MMEQPQFYHYAEASGLVDSERLADVWRFVQNNKDQTAVLPAPLIFEPVDLRHIQHLPQLRNTCYKQKYAASQTQQPNVVVVQNDSLDGEKVEESTVSPLDRQLAAELVRSGLLNDWQSRQLLEGRTKFTLGRYRILDALGEGGYGHVFFGIENSIWQAAGKKKEKREKEEKYQYVALKVLPLTRATEDLTQRFLHEIDIQRNLNHPNLVSFLTAGRDGNVNYMVHEFVNGGDLRMLFYKNGILPLEIITAAVRQIADALIYLHGNGIVHRDIKPGNILLSSDGTAKLTDMGLSVRYNRNALDIAARRAEENFFLDKQIDEATQLSGKIAGTVDFMAPDQIRNPANPSPAWDIYSLGCTLYQLLTGSVPFPAGDTKQKLWARLQGEPREPRVLNPAIPFGIADLLKKMMIPNPFDRLTANGVAERLDAWIPPTGLLYGLQF